MSEIEHLTEIAARLRQELNECEATAAEWVRHDNRQKGQIRRLEKDNERLRLKVEIHREHWGDCENKLAKFRAENRRLRDIYEEFIEVVRNADPPWEDTPAWKTMRESLREITNE